MQYPFTVLKNTDEVPDKIFQYGVVVLKSFVDEDVATQSGNLVLGTWQGIYLCEHRNQGSSRHLVLTVFGSLDGS